MFISTYLFVKEVLQQYTQNKRLRLQNTQLRAKPIISTERQKYLFFYTFFLQIKLLDLHSIFERKHMFDSILNRDEQSI